jgi:hypothetical protein
LSVILRCAIYAAALISSFADITLPAIDSDIFMPSSDDFSSFFSCGQRLPFSF